MKILFTLPVLFFIAILLTGCPYESKVALDNSPKVKINSNLVGDWYSISAEDAKNGKKKDFEFTGSKIVVKKKNELVYIMTKYIIDSTEEYNYDSRYESFLSEVSGSTFINITKLYESEYGKGATYYIYKIKIEDNIVTLYPVSDYIKEKFNSSDDFKNFVSKYKDLSFFYSTEENYSKK